MVNAEDTPSGNLLTTAAPALVNEPAAASATEAAAAAMAMTEAETKPAEAAEVVQARSLPLRSPRTNHHVATENAMPQPQLSLRRYKWKS